MANVLVIDDNESMRDGMAIAIDRMGHTVSSCSGGEQGVETFRKSHFDLVITDLKMAPIDGYEVVRRIRKIDSEAVVMVVTAWGSIEAAVEAMRLGAFDFITKPFPPEVLRAKVEKGLEVAEMKHDVAGLRTKAEAFDGDSLRGAPSIVGSSEAIQKTVSMAKKVAASDATVLITGESGTGKELIARAIHDCSGRKTGPFVAVHCAALAESLLETELFGHEKGAFTGAVKRKLGRFELANRGTLFLDEVGEISPSIQAKLLRVLQLKEFERVGGEKTLQVDVRVVSATNRDLTAEVAKGTFREDLFYRLHMVPIHVPPLRDRPGDIGELADYLLKLKGPSVNRKVKRIGAEAKAALESYRWPGNVRELENVIVQAIVFCDGEELTVADLPGAVGKRRSSEFDLKPNLDKSLPEILEDLERQLIVRALEKGNGVKTEVSRLLGIKASSLYYKLQKYGLIDPAEKPTPDA